MKKYMIVFLLALSSSLYAQKQKPKAYFEVPNNIKENSVLHLKNLSKNATDYQWNVNGESTSQIDFGQKLNEHGYYCIELIAKNKYGSDSYSKIIYVNTEQCPCEKIKANISGDFKITHDTEWNKKTFDSNIIYIDGTIIIKKGKTLKIDDNLVLKFSEQSRIIVEQAATLELANTTLTKYDSCGMWQGIEVWGESGDDSYSPMQGIVSLDEISIIEYAHIGILLGKRNMDCICEHMQNGFIDEGDKYEWQKSGGLVRNISTDNARFSRNGIDIKYNMKGERESSANQLHNIYFESNTGVNPTLVDYNYNTLATNPYPNVYIPWSGNANPKQRTWMGIQMENLKGIEINNCSFKEKEYAIHSINSQYDVFNSDFEELSNGIYALHNFHSVFNRHEIADNFFDQIHDDVTSEGKAIYISNGFSDYIHDNRFRNFSICPHTCMRDKSLS